MLEIKKVILIAGEGGARMDFVAGWLGTLPQFLDNEWHMDPLTGQSYGFMRHTKTLDVEKCESFSNFFRGYFTINPAADLCYAGSLHASIPDNIQDAVNSGMAELLIIDTSTVRFSHIHWECVVKTLLSQLKTRGTIDRWTKPWYIDQTINKISMTNLDRIALVKQYLRREPNRRICCGIPSPALISHKKAGYNLLFQPGGSRYLCNILGLPEVSERYHNFWDCQLPLATSPDSLVVWGETWNKSDYFK
jgi:hypothetical protein